jgi:hypothetical protein
MSMNDDDEVGCLSGFYAYFASSSPPTACGASGDFSGLDPVISGCTSHFLANTQKPYVLQVKPGTYRLTSFGNEITTFSYLPSIGKETTIMPICTPWYKPGNDWTVLLKALYLISQVIFNVPVQGCFFFQVLHKDTNAPLRFKLQHPSNYAWSLNKISCCKFSIDTYNN